MPVRMEEISAPTALRVLDASFMRSPRRDVDRVARTGVLRRSAKRSLLAW